MTLSPLIEQYVASRHSLGIKFYAQAKILRSFCRQLGDLPLPELPADDVRAFLGTAPVTLNYHQKLGALRGFYRFAIARGHATASPLPAVAPKRPPRFVPHIFSVDELRRLLDAVTVPSLSKMAAPTLRTLLLLLYGAGLRISEALSLQTADVDLREDLLLIRDSKFYKSRLVPIGAPLHGVLAGYAKYRRGLPPPAEHTSIFVTKKGEPVIRQCAEANFRRLCALAKVERRDSCKVQPRLHDLRHTFAVHRLLAWYREGADVTHLLPRLSTYLGHVSLRSTTYYLTMTPELLHEAGLRFERYASGGGEA